MANDGLTNQPQSGYQLNSMGVLEDVSSLLGIYFKHNVMQKLFLVLSQRQQLIMQLNESKALEKSLMKKIVQEKQRYSDLLGKYEEIKQSEGLEKSTLKEKQKFSDLLAKYEELQSSVSLGSDVQMELTKLQTKMENVNISLEKVETIRNYWGDKVLC